LLRADVGANIKCTTIDGAVERIVVLLAHCPKVVRRGGLCRYRASVAASMKPPR
jgi:hypothetical protein